MNEDVFNIQIRKFLKRVGIESQRQIERAVQTGIDSGQLSGDETLTASVRLTVNGIGLEHNIEDTIKLE